MGVLVAYVAALPLYRVGLVTVGTKTVVPSDVLFVVLLVAATAAKAWRRPSSRLAVVAALPAAATAGVALLGNAPPAPAMTEVLRTAYSMATLLALASLGLGREDQRLAMRGWTVTAAAVCIIGLAAFAAVVFFGVPANPIARPNLLVIRIAGIMETNTLTLYLVSGIGFAAFLARFGDSVRDQRLGTAALLLFGFTALAAASRGAVGFMLAMALLAWRGDLAPPWLTRHKVAVGLSAALLLIAGGAVTLWAVFPVSVGANSQGQQELNWNSGPSAYRVLHNAGLRMYSAHPLFGVGPGSFGLRLAEFRMTEEWARAWPRLDPRLRWSPHSTWIGMLAEGGLLQFLAWAAAITWVTRRLLQRPRHDDHLANYVGLAFLGLLANGFHVDLLHLKFVWASVGLGLSEVQPNPRSSDAQPADRCSVALSA